MYQGTAHSAGYLTGCEVLTDDGSSVSVTGEFGNFSGSTLPTTTLVINPSANCKDSMLHTDLLISMRAAANCTSISALSTVAIQVAEQGRMTYLEAYEAVKTMMDLDASVDVCNDNSLATALATRARRSLLAEGDAAVAMDTMKKALVLLNTVMALSSATGNSSVAISTLASYATVASVSDASIDLTNSTTLLTIFSSVPDADEAQMSTITAGLANMNALQTSDLSLVEVFEASHVAQTDLMTNIASLLASNISADEFSASSSTTSLTSALNAATLPAWGPPPPLPTVPASPFAPRAALAPPAPSKGGDDFDVGLFLGLFIPCLFMICCCGGLFVLNNCDRQRKVGAVYHDWMDSMRARTRALKKTPAWLKCRDIFLQMQAHAKALQNKIVAKTNQLRGRSPESSPEPQLPGEAPGVGYTEEANPAYTAVDIGDPEAVAYPAEYSSVSPPRDDGQPRAEGLMLVSEQASPREPTPAMPRADQQIELGDVIPDLSSSIDETGNDAAGTEPHEPDVGNNEPTGGPVPINLDAMLGSDTESEASAFNAAFDPSEREPEWRTYDNPAAQEWNTYENENPQFAPTAGRSSRDPLQPPPPNTGADEVEDEFVKF